MATWPDLFLVQHAPSSPNQSSLHSLSLNETNTSPRDYPREGRMMGYLMGKLEGHKTDWHSHVTAITVSPEYRRLGLAKGMMEVFEKSSDQYTPKYTVVDV